MTAAAAFLAGSLLLIAVAGIVLWVAFAGPGVARAVVVSGVAALAIQAAAFAIAQRGAGTPDVVASWGLGILVRFLALGAYAFAIIRLLGLASGPALVSLATFLFLSTLIEPLFLKR